MEKYLLPNGNDLVLALYRAKRPVIRRKITRLSDFMSRDEWFALPAERRKALMHGTVSCREGIWLRRDEVWLKLRLTGDELEMDAGAGWEPFPWP